MLHDFSETICRGCCNYEGADRVEDVIHYSRILRKSWENNENGARSVKQERLNSAGSSVSLTPSPPPANGLFHEQRRATSRFQSPHRLAEEGAENSMANSGNHPQNPSPDNLNINTNGVGRQRVQGASIGSRETERRQFGFEEPRHVMPNGTSFPRSPAVMTPVQNFTDNRRSERVRETLTTLNQCAPFSVRLKKDHSLIGVVFAFDIMNHKPSIEPELKILIEYPRGSGNEFHTAAGVAKQMTLESPIVKEMARSMSSGFKYLEYEKEREKNDWRPLGDLLPEPVRFFKDAVNLKFLPQPRLDMVNIALLKAKNPFHQHPGLALARKRKMAMDLEEYEVASGKHRVHPPLRLSRDDIHHQQWIQSQIEAGKMPPSNSGVPVPPGTPVNTIPSASVVPIMAVSQGKMNAVLSVSDAHGRVPPKSPMGPAMNRFDTPMPGTRDELRLTGNLVMPTGAPVSEGLSPRQQISPRLTVTLPGVKTAETQSTATDGDPKERGTGMNAGIVTCVLCHEKLEDTTHFVQCPSVPHHKFCFPCSRESIKKQPGSEVFCPSGERCPLQGSNLPWVFMQREIATILGTEVVLKKEKET